MFKEASHPEARSEDRVRFSSQSKTTDLQGTYVETVVVPVSLTA